MAVGSIHDQAARAEVKSREEFARQVELMHLRDSLHRLYFSGQISLAQLEAREDPVLPDDVLKRGYDNLLIERQQQIQKEGAANVKDVPIASTATTEKPIVFLSPIEVAQREGQVEQRKQAELDVKQGRAPASLLDQFPQPQELLGEGTSFAVLPTAAPTPTGPTTAPERAGAADRRTDAPGRRGELTTDLLGSNGGTTVTRPGARKARPKLSLFGE